MSDSVYSYNLLPVPKPGDTADWAFRADKSIPLQLQLPAGTYRFGADVSDQQGVYPQNLLRVVIVPRTELTPATWGGQAGRIVTPDNQPVLSVTRASASRLVVAA